MKSLAELDEVIKHACQGCFLNVNHPRIYEDKKQEVKDMLIMASDWLEENQLYPKTREIIRTKLQNFEPCLILKGEGKIYSFLMHTKDVSRHVFDTFSELLEYIESNEVI